MIPLRDSTRSRTTPVVVYSLIAASVGAFLYAQGFGSDAALMTFYERYGAVPRTVAAGPWPQAWLGLLTSMFLHGSWMHLGGNMLYLWVFGDNVEDAMGHVGFLVFYLLAGTLAALAHIATHASSAVPLVGASGAIAGVLGAYVILYPGARILSVVFFVFLIRLVELPAALVLSLWFVLQLVQGLATLAAPGIETVAWWAHVGGFAAGVVLVRVFARR
ncbi:MAG: rhomboid family intramembrane serine protease [Armatimonadota bacterium]|nr:rhomboid family intramembrane serine protease [Armatimonadota bacterium]